MVIRLGLSYVLSLFFKRVLYGAEAFIELSSESIFNF